MGWLGPRVAGQLMMTFQFVYMVGSLVSGSLNDKVYRGHYRLQVMLAFILTGGYFIVKFPRMVDQGPNPLLLTVMLVTAFFIGKGIATVMAFISKSYPEHISEKVGGMAMGLGLIAMRPLDLPVVSSRCLAAATAH